MKPLTPLDAQIREDLWAHVEAVMCAVPAELAGRLFGKALRIVQQTTLPLVLLVDTPTGMLCPWDGCAGTRMAEVDYGLRVNELSDLEDGNIEIEQGERDFHTLYYRCTRCLRGVTIPLELSVIWS